MKFEIYEIIDGMEIYRGYRESKEEAEFVKVNKEAAGHDVKIVKFAPENWGACSKAWNSLPMS